jgi:hypothetical protein
MGRLKMVLRLKDVPALQGVGWVRHGLKTFARRPLGFASQVVAFFFATMVVSLVLPGVGSVLALMALPLLTLGAMLGTQQALSGGQVHPGQLVEMLRRPGAPRKALLKLCALYGLLTLAVVLLTQLLMGDAVQQLENVYNGAGTPAEPATPADGTLLAALAVQAVGVSLISVPFWHAPALVAWGGQGLGQALFSSTLAVWRCRGAFLVYGLVWFGLTLLLGTLAALLAALFGAPKLAAVAALPLALLLMTAFYASLWFTFADSFDLERTPADAASE